MGTVQTADDLQRRIKEAARQLRDLVDQNVSGNLWQAAYCDSNSPAGQTPLQVVIVESPSGKTDRLLELPPSHASFFDYLQNDCGKLFDRPWIGVRLWIFPDRPYQISYSYSPALIAIGFYQAQSLRALILQPWRPVPAKPYQSSISRSNDLTP